MKPLVIIPAYNEKNNLLSLINEINCFHYDYIVVNDSSNDGTEEYAKENNIKCLSLPVNMGITYVTQIGFKYAIDNGYDCAVCIDGDGQHLPSYIDKLISELEQGNDYVIGSRFIKKNKPLSFRMFGSSILSFLIKIKTGTSIKDPTSGMRAMNLKIVQLFSNNMNFYSEPDTVCHLLKKHYKIKEVQVEMRERTEGKSYFKSPWKSIKYMFSEIIMILLVR